MNKKLPSGILADNRAARFHYEVLETFEAGIVLTGVETKSCRVSRPNLKGAFVAVDRHGEAWLKGVFIPAYRFAKGVQHEPRRDRKLLLSKKEIIKIGNALNEKGVAGFPLDMHMRGSHVKVRIGLGRGKKQRDKREAIKKRDIEREVQRGLK